MGGSERAVLSRPPGIVAMRVYFSWLSFILVATSAVAASNETGGPEPDQIYQTAFKEFKAAESDCQQAPTAQALTRMSKAAQALADATTARLQKQRSVALQGSSTPEVSPRLPAKKAGGEIADFFKKLSNDRLSLSESPGIGSGDGKPARFSYSQDFKKGSSGAQFNTNFYLHWDLDPEGIPSSFFLPHDLDFTNAVSLSAQGKLSSADTKSTDAWRFRFVDVEILARIRPELRLRSSVERSD